jgi:hypothetical protein
MKKLIFRLFLTLLIAAGAWGAYTALKKIPQAREATLPTTRVRQGDVIVRSYARGELRAVRAIALNAPNLFGTVQVTKLAPLGSFSREKDLIAEFDDSELLSRVEEKQLELDQIDEQFKKSQAELAIRDNQDRVELLRAQYSVRRAELEVQRNPLLGEIDQQRNLLNLEEAKRRLKQLESDIKSRQDQARAELDVLRSRKEKAQVEMARERARLMQVKLLAPMSGLVAIKQNRGGFFVGGQTQPDIREGDQLQPGMPVAEVLDLSEMEVIARIGELDRANLFEGQEVLITLDALADKQLNGKIKSMSGTASSNVFANDPAKKFDVIFSIDMRQLLAHLGATKEQIARVLATAEANRNKPLIQAPSFAALAAMAGGGGGFGGGEGGPRQFGFRAGGGEGGGAGGGRGGFGGLTDEQRQKMQEVRQKILGGRSMQDLSPEERTQMMQKMQEELAKAGITMPQRGGQRGGQGGEAQSGSQGGERRARGEGGGRGDQSGAGERGGERQARGERGGRGGEGRGGEGRSGSANRFTEQDMANAKLPPPPEEDSQLEVLLRPGLLADVEIIVEKIPNAINVPAQAVFERESGYVVFVKEGNRFAPRSIKLMKRSENTMVIAQGLKAGEEISLLDPVADKAGRKGSDKGGGAGAPMMPGGKKGE